MRGVSTIAALVVLLAACGNPVRSTATTRTASAAPGGAAASPSALPTERPSEAPTDTSLPSFSCSAQTFGKQAAPVQLRDVRVGTHPTYDRFVLEFAAPPPQYDARPQKSAQFVEDPSGKPVTLLGNAGIQVIIHGANSHDSSGSPTLPASKMDLKTGFPVLKEARQVGDFEGVVTWALGLDSAKCFRVAVLTNPNRLVMDIQH